MLCCPQARLLVDVHSDTSLLLGSLLSVYQEKALALVFHGDALARDKFSLVFAKTIRPRPKTAAEALGNVPLVNEFKQVVGDVVDVVDLDDSPELAQRTLLVVGRNGVLLAGRSARMHESVVLLYLSLACREMFVAHLFARTYVSRTHTPRTRGPGSIADDRWVLGRLVVVVAGTCSAARCSACAPSSRARTRTRATPRTRGTSSRTRAAILCS